MMEVQNAHMLIKAIWQPKKSPAARSSFANIGSKGLRELLKKQPSKGDAVAMWLKELLINGILKRS